MLFRDGYELVISLMGSIFLWISHIVYESRVSFQVESEETTGARLTSTSKTEIVKHKTNYKVCENVLK